MASAATGLGEIWNLIGIVQVSVALAISFWDGVTWSVVIPEFIAMPILLAGRHPG